MKDSSLTEYEDACQLDDEVYEDGFEDWLQMNRDEVMREFAEEQPEQFKEFARQVYEDLNLKNI